MKSLGLVICVHHRAGWFARLLGNLKFPKKIFSLMHEVFAIEMQQYFGWEAGHNKDER